MIVSVWSSSEVGNLWEWSIDAAGATVAKTGDIDLASSTIAAGSITLTGATGTHNAISFPTIGITDTVLKALFADIGTPGDVCTITIPVKLSVTYEGSDGSQTGPNARTRTTVPASVTFTITVTS